jgi:adenylate cyclase
LKRTSPRKSSGVLSWIVGALLVGGLCFSATEGLIWLSSSMVRPPHEALANQLTDVAFQIRLRNDAHAMLPPEQVVIVDIDDASIRRLGRTQLWPRAYDARAIAHIAAGFPRCIGIDYLYTEPDTLSEAYADLLRRSGFERTEEILAALRTDDELNSAIRDAGNVYLSFFTEDRLREVIQDTVSWSMIRTFRSEPGVLGKTPEAGHLVLPVREFTESARAVGAIAMPAGADGAVRRYQLLQRVKQADDSFRFAANFPLYMLQDEFGIPDDSIRVVKSGLALAEDVVLPIRTDGTFCINWLGSDESIRYISFYKVLEGLIPSEFFEGKYVFFGTSASGLQDLKTVPCRADKMPGVEVHAVAFLNMMNNAFIREISEVRAMPLYFLISILLVGLMLLIRPLVSFFIALALVFGEMSAYILYFLPERMTIFPVVTLMLLTVVAYIFSSLYIYFIRERRNRLLKSAFASYVPRDVVERIARDASVVKLGGEKKVLTVLFSDIRGFTSFSEKMDPQDLVAMLNNYLSKMSEAIFRHKGTIDKFIGDAIMAIFGAPIEQPDHADRACEVALDMVAALEGVNRDQAVRKHPPLAIGIGLNTGEMTVGNIGSQKRFDYTVIGDSVNLGSRLEGLTKYFGIDILVSESTLQACTPGRFLFRELASVVVKGKDHPVGVYELIGRVKDEAKHASYLSEWERAFQHLRHRELGEALLAFEHYLTLRPDDAAARHFIRLCREYADKPESFSLVLKMESK